MKTSLQDLLTQDGPVFIDGATGTMMFELGLQHGDPPELWNVEQPEKVRGLHREYIEAGAQIILTNTFGGNRLRLGLHNLSERAAELNKAAALLARAEADAAVQSVVVAGSIGPTGGIMLPYGDLEFDEALSVFEEQARALIEGGVDALWIETMSDLEEVRAAVEGSRRVEPDFPLVATMTFDTNGHTMMGVSPEKALETLTSFNLLALGGNCGNGPAEIEAVIEKMAAANPDLPLVAKSNAGIPQLIKGVAVYDATPERMADHATHVHQLGAKIIGGCCGNSPNHVRAMVGALRQQVSGA